MVSNDRTRLLHVVHKGITRVCPADVRAKGHEIAVGIALGVAEHVIIGELTGVAVGMEEHGRTAGPSPDHLRGQRHRLSGGGLPLGFDGAPGECPKRWHVLRELAKHEKAPVFPDIPGGRVHGTRGEGASSVLGARHRRAEAESTEPVAIAEDELARRHQLVASLAFRITLYKRLPDTVAESEVLLLARQVDGIDSLHNSKPVSRGFTGDPLNQLRKRRRFAGIRHDDDMHRRINARVGSPAPLRRGALITIAEHSRPMVGHHSLAKLAGGVQDRVIRAALAATARGGFSAATGRDANTLAHGGRARHPQVH